MIKRSIKSAIELTVDNLVSFSLLTLLYSLIYIANVNQWYIATPTVTLIPLILGLGVLTSYSSKHGLNAGHVVLQTPKIAWFRLFGLGIIPIVIFTTIQYFVQTDFFQFTIDIYQQNTLNNPNVLQGITVDMLIWLLFCGLVSWFAVPLIVLKDYSLISALKSSVIALYKNDTYITVIFIIILALLASLAFPLLALLPIFFISTLMYTSYTNIDCSSK